MKTNQVFLSAILLLCSQGYTVSEAQNHVQGHGHAHGHGHEHGHGHQHITTPHDGIVAKLFDETKTQHGYIELKLHDDKGDLELWLAKDSSFKQPLDLPLSSAVQATFIDVDNRSVELRPRNTVQNEDENGLVNIREGKTNYFIFPHSAKDDASWLRGLEFQSIVTVTLTIDGKKFISEEFLLLPHSHAPGRHAPH